MAINFSQVSKIELPNPTYDELSYIYFNGTDNYIPNLVCKFPTIEFELLRTTGKQYIFYVNSLYEAYVNDTTLHVRYGYYGQGTSAYSITDNIQSNVRYRLVLSSTVPDTLLNVKIYQGDTLVAEKTIRTDSAPSSTTPCELMGYYYLNRPRNCTNCKLYSYTANGVVYVPYIDKSTNKVGLCRSSNFNKYDMQGTVTSESKGSIIFPSTYFAPLNVKQIQNANNVVLWRDVRLVSITLSGQTTSLPINSQFSFGGTVTATYSDGTTADVTASTTFSGYDMTTSGTQTITASYTEVGVTRTATYSLQVVALTSIALSGQTTSFNVGDTFSFGGTVTATYSNGTTANVTSSTTFSGYDMSTAGTQTVTATYTESGITQTATYTITVTSATWHTVWSGNKTATVLFDESHAGTAYGAGDIVSTSSLRAGVPTKVSFNQKDAASSSKITKRGTSSGSWNVSSPQEFTSAAIGQDLLYMNLVSTASSSCKNSVSLYTKAGGKIGIWIGNISGTGSNYPQTRINFTKIEQYY